MSELKNIYAIVNKKSGKIYVDCSRLSLYYDKQVAQEVMKYFDVDQEQYCIKPVDIKKLNKII